MPEHFKYFQPEINKEKYRTTFAVPFVWSNEN